VTKIALKHTKKHKNGGLRGDTMKPISTKSIICRRYQHHRLSLWCVFQQNINDSWWSKNWLWVQFSSMLSISVINLFMDIVQLLSILI